MAEKSLNIPFSLSPVKPASVSNLHIAHNDTLVHVEWAPPSGPVPVQCLEYELEITTVNHNGSKEQVSTQFFIHLTTESSLTPGFD